MMEKPYYLQGGSNLRTKVTPADNADIDKVIDKESITPEESLKVINLGGLEHYNGSIDGSISNALQIADTAHTKAEEANANANFAQDSANTAYIKADEAYTKADEAYSATRVYDPTTGIPDTEIGIALSNVYTKAEDANNNAYNAQQRAEDAQQRAEDAYNNANFAQDSANTAYTKAEDAQQRADEAYNSTRVYDPTTGSSDTEIGTALNNVYETLNYRISDDASGLVVLAVLVRDFTLKLSLVGNGKCIRLSTPDEYPISFDDTIFNEYYNAVREGEVGVTDSFYTYIMENTSRKVTLKFEEDTLPTFKVTNIAYPDYNLDIIIDDMDVQKVFADKFGLQHVVALRMLAEPIVVGDNNDNCYWALVTEDGTVHNPGTY